MLRTTIAKSYIHRTIRPLYGWTQATPKTQYLDPAWDRSIDIWPGMAMMRTAGENVSLIDGTGFPYGLAGLYVGGDGIDEPEAAGLNVMTVWVLGPDAEFEILDPAFDSDVSWVDPGNGTNLLVHAQTTGANQGKLVPAGTSGASAKPVARLVKVNSTKKITIAGLAGTSA